MRRPACVMRTIAAAAVFGIAGSLAVMAQESKPAKAKKRLPFKPSANVTAEQESAATALAKEHHPELVSLLIRLKIAEPQEYRRAVHDLYRARQRLEQIKGRDADRYPQELRAWELKSRTQLLAARLQLSPDDASVRAELKKHLLELANLRIERMAEERRRLAEKLEQTDAQLERLRAERDGQVEKQIDALTHRKHTAESRKQPPQPDEKQPSPHKTSPPEKDR